MPPNVSRDFNPRTPVGCDPVRTNSYCSVLRFQSTHPSGVRPAPQHHRQRISGISIHAPQWGATGSFPTRWRRPTNFNPRTPVGCDPADTGSCWATVDFNPRTPVGCDDTIFNNCHNYGISIHAPQWGATGYGNRRDNRRIISIHAPQWGATSPSLRRPYSARFQSTHPSGVRPREWA